MSVPARLHVLLAREARVGVVLRRGPSNQVATLLWDRKTDKFKMGQWFKGRIYERRCDLSPNGKFMIYFAANHQKNEARGSWTAISRAPYIKALALFSKGDCWDGGGLFTSNKSFWLNDGYGHQVLFNTGHVARDSSFTYSNHRGGEDLEIYFPRLIRDGWREFDDSSLISRRRDAWAFEKDLGNGWILYKTVLTGNVKERVGRGVYWEEHAMRRLNSQELLEFPDWEWADVEGTGIAWAEGGKLMRAKVGPEGLRSIKVVQDFNEMKFENIAAPY